MKIIKTLGLLAALGISGCSKPSADAEAQLAIVQHGGSPREVCEAHRKIAAAYLVEKNEPKYHDAKLSSDIYCLRADQLERL